MNILLITQEDFLAGSTYSVSYIAKGLAEKGHSVFVAARADSLLESLVRGSKATFVPMTLRSRFSPVSLKELARLVKDKNIQLINAQSSKDRYLAIFIKWFYRLPVVVVHTRRQYPRADGGWFQKMIYVHGTDKIVAISHELKRIFVAKGYPENHFHVIHNGIPSDKFKMWSAENVDALRKKFNLRPTDIVIGSVSRYKRQEQIVRALPLLKNDAIKLMLVGVELGKFDSLAAKLNIKNPIIYAGFVEGTDVLNYYKLFNVNILASITDGFGLVLLESMAMGCPVIATNFGGIKDVVTDRSNGLLFEDEDIDGLARCIRTLLSDTQLQARLVENGFTAAFDTFAMERTVNNYEAFFESLIQQR